MPTLLLRAFCALLPLAVSAPLLAQQDPTTESDSNQSDSGSDDSDVTTLAPFEVRSEKDRGYAAANTISGSRLNTKLADTPAAISVFTRQFIDDIGATSVDDLAEYAINTGNNLLDGPTASLTNNDPILDVRGFSAGGGGGRFTNFFKSSISQDTYNMERAELTRGPNSVLFGVGLPAGGFNTSTKKADVRRSSYATSLRTGSYGQVRGTVDLDQPLVTGKFGIRLNGVYDDRNDWRPFAFKRDERWDLATRWQINSKTRFDFDYEHGHRHFATAPQSGVLDSLTPWISAGRQIDTAVGQPPGQAANTALRNAGMQLVSSGNSYVYDMTSGIVYNVARQSVGASAGETPGVPAAPGEDNPMIFDFDIVPRDVFLGGPAYGTLNDFSRTTAVLSRELTRSLFIEAAYNREAVNNLASDTLAGGNRVLVDTNAYLPDGSVNPHAGEYYVEQFPTLRRRDTLAEDYRLMVSYSHDFSIRQSGVWRWLGRHQLAFMFQGGRDQQLTDQEQEYVVENPVNTSVPDNNANRLRRRSYIDLSAPLDTIGLADYTQYPADGLINQSNGLPISTAFLPFGQPRDTMDKTLTNLYVWQASFLGDRIVTTLGYRSDRLRDFGSSAMRGPAFGPFAQGALYPVRDDTASSGSGITRTQGLVVKPLRWVSLFYNHSSSFSLPPRTVTIFPDDPAPSALGTTDDFGLKFSLLGGRMFATLTYYTTSALHQAGNAGVGGYVNNVNRYWAALDGAGILAANNLTIDDVTVFANGRTFDQDSNGVEFELTANPLKNWRLIMNFSANKTIQSNTALEMRNYYADHSAFFTEGDRGRLVLDGQPGEMASQAIDDSDGVTTVAEQLQSDLANIDELFVAPDGVRQLGQPVATANLRSTYTHDHGLLKGFSWGGGLRWRGERVITYTSSDPAIREAIRGNDTYTVDANAAYRTKLSMLGKRYDLTVQLNVNNLLDDDQLIITRAFTDGRPRSFSLPTPREWFVTATVKF